MAFTEQGVAMLSQIQARIDRIELEINGELSDHQNKIEMILEAIKQLIAPPAKERKQIGFRRNARN